jgi:hypothetical protein
MAAQLTAEQMAELTFLVQQYAASAQQLRVDTGAEAQAAWEQFDAWYDPAAVAAVAASVVALSAAAQDVTAGISQQFVASTVALLRGSKVDIPRATRVPLRNGADPILVNMRTAARFKRAIATGADPQQAIALALQRSQSLTATDLALTNRNEQNALLKALGVTGYRRVIHPELATKTGTCGLCIVAADRIYHTGELMPIHPPSCNCTVMPIVGDLDPGKTMNEIDLRRLYRDAGSNKAEDLRTTRYQVNEHGEFGPYLSKASDNFRGPDKVALEDDPARAARMLEQTLPVLQRLEAAGGPAGPLEYQRELVARLQRIAGHAGAVAAA